MIRVSVVVPTYKRTALLNRCLSALVFQEFPGGEAEIIVADDGPSLDSQRIVESWARRSRFPVRYVPVLGPHGPAAARNEGWRRAEGRIIAFTDDDCIPDRRWLEQGVAAFRPGVLAVTGRTLVPIPFLPTDYERNAANMEHSDFITANCFCLREALQAVNGFDPRFTAAWREDSDLYYSLLSLDRSTISATAPIEVGGVAGQTALKSIPIPTRSVGPPVAVAPHAIVIHPVRPAPWGVSLKQQRNNLFEALLYKKHPRRYRMNVRRRPPLFYYSIVVSLACALMSAALDWSPGFAVGAAAWTSLTLLFATERLNGTARSWRHITEMLVTSALIPPVALYWRLRGALRFRVPFF